MVLATCRHKSRTPWWAIGRRVQTCGKSTDAEYSLTFTEVENDENRIVLNSLYNVKVSPRLTLRSGILGEYITNDSFLNDRENQPDLDNDGDPDLTEIYRIDGGYMIAQPYSQAQYRVTEKLTLIGGLHAQYSNLNDQFVLEPRVAADYEFLPGNTVKLGFRNF